MKLKLITLLLLTITLIFVGSSSAFFGTNQRFGMFINSNYAAPGGGGPAVGDGLILEAGTDFLLLETGDYLLLE